MDILNPEDLAKEGQAAYQRGEYSAAAALFNQAAQGYLKQNAPLLAAEMDNNQSVAWLQSGDAQAALDAVGESANIFATANDPLKEAMAYGNRAAALDGLDRLEEAEADYVRCAEMLKALGEDELRSQVMQSLSALQLRTGRQLEAIASMQAGVTGLKKPSFTQRILKKILGIPQKLFNR